MPQKFIHQLEQASRRRGRRRWLTATCWALAALIGGGFGLVGLDYALSINDWIGRLMLTTALVASIGAIYGRWRLAVSKHPVTPLQIAQEVERRHPELGDVVSSAWDFGQQADDDPTAGSESLRRAVVLRAEVATEDIDWHQLTPRKPLRKSALALASAALLASFMGWWQPQMTSIGLARLISPFKSVEWPREHDLQFVQPPTLLAAGEDLVLQLRDTRGALPSSIVMHYRTRQQGRWREETQSLAATTDPLEIRRPSVQESLEYRATGSDHHTMPWQSLEVVAPPRVESLQVTVHPPAYTDLPAQAWDKNTSLYAGSDLELQGRTDQPVTQVVLRSRQGTKLPAQVGPARRVFRIEPSAWKVTESDTYTLQFTTVAGLTVRSATELALEVKVDQPPQVRFLEPVRDLSVVPTVAVPLVIEASDELAVRQIELVYHRSDRSNEGEQRLPLWRAANHGADKSAVRRQRVEFLWELAALSLEPGSIVEVRAQANDAQPATGQTVRALRLNVVTEDELWRQLVDQQAHLVETLAQLLREQRELRGVTADWAEFPGWSTARWANASHAALFRQRQITATLASGQQSVLSQLAELSQTIERNRLLRPEAADRLHAAQFLLQNLVDDPLAAAEQSLTAATRQTQRSLDREVLATLFSETALHQDQAVEGLRRAVELLMPGNVLGRLERELMAIQADQTALAEHCRTEIAPPMLQSDQVDPTEQAQLASAVRRQRALAGRLAEMMLDMAQAAERLVDSEPALAVRLAETGTLAEELDLQATLQSSADQLARRRLGRATSLQRQTLDDLAKLLARLAGRDAEGSAERFERLQNAERKLERLRRQVAALERELRKLTPEQRELERLRRQRDKLAQQTQELTRQLERLRLPRAAAATRTAASRLGRAQLDSETTKQAKQQLDAAQQQLTTERRRQQVALARLQMAQLDTKLKAFVGRQQTVLDEILRLENLRQDAGQLDTAQQQSVGQLSERQADLRDEVLAQADALVSLPVFAHVLKMAAATMQSVEDRLQQTELGQPTPGLAEQAVRQLTQLAEAVRQEQQNLSSSNRGSGGAGEGNTGDKPQEQTLQLALGQLRLLKSLQTALREKTRNLEKQLATGQPPTDLATTDLATELARQQQQLTELARQLVPEPPDPPSEELFPNLEQELEQSLDEIRLPRSR